MNKVVTVWHITTCDVYNTHHLSTDRLQTGSKLCHSTVSFRNPIFVASWCVHIRDASKYASAATHTMYSDIARILAPHISGSCLAAHYKAICTISSFRAHGLLQKPICHLASLHADFYCVYGALQVLIMY